MIFGIILIVVSIFMFLFGQYPWIWLIVSTIGGALIGLHINRWTVVKYEEVSKFKERSKLEILLYQQKLKPLMDKLNEAILAERKKCLMAHKELTVFILTTQQAATYCEYQTHIYEGDHNELADRLDEGRGLLTFNDHKFRRFGFDLVVKQEDLSFVSHYGNGPQPLIPTESITKNAKAEFEHWWATSQDIHHASNPEVLNMAFTAGWAAKPDQVMVNKGMSVGKSEMVALQEAIRAAATEIDDKCSIECDTIDDEKIEIITRHLDGAIL